MFSKVSMAARCGRKLKSLVQRNSSTMQALLNQSAQSRQLPRGISLQVLDERHNLNQIRDFLARSFVANNEPIVHVLGEIYYPAVSLDLRIPLIEERFKSLFSQKSMLQKVEQGLSFVAVKDNDPTKLVSVMFAENYSGCIYKGESIIDDPLCRTGLNLMRTVQENAEPTLEEYSKTRSIVFVSHTATHPKYRSLGIVQYACDTLRARYAEQQVGLYCLMTAHRFAQFLIQRYGMEVIAEVFYKDYQDNGRRVFEKLAEQEISAKALILCL